jgi:two-component system phosphate regulon sensor histidine kinase PhoR
MLKLLLMLFFGTLIGNQFHNIWLGLLAALCIYVGSMLWSYRRFQMWLDSGAIDQKPLVDSFWASIIDQVERLITRLKKENQALLDDVDFFKDSFQALESAVIVLDGDTRIDWCNQAALPMLGIDYKRDRSRLLTNLLRAPEFVRYLEQGEYNKPLKLTSPRDVNRHFEIQATPFRSEDLLLFVRDVSDLVALERTRQDFAANVSHELRTPLTVITGYLETLKDSTAQLPPIWLKAIEEMLRQSNRMDSMVADLIFLSRLESVPDDQDHESVALEALLTSIIEDARISSGNETTITLTTPQSDDNDLPHPLRLIGSYVELRSAFSNLIQNAVKYTQSNGEIQVRCFRQQQEFFVQVSDNGEGIDPVHIPRLTERFYRVDDSRTASTGGTGLGLAIVKHVLARHGGRLSISSKLGVGSRFTCVFPLDRVTDVKRKS